MLILPPAKLLIRNEIHLEHNSTPILQSSLTLQSLFAAEKTAGILAIGVKPETTLIISAFAAYSRLRVWQITQASLERALIWLAEVHRLNRDCG
jgi:hypothetical protein